MDAKEPNLTEVDAFAMDLAREDDLGAVVRAHIRIESCLVNFVEGHFHDSKHLARMSLVFDDYVSLFMAFGVAEAWGPCLRAMGSLRNRFAHKLNTTLDVQAVNNLYDALPSEGKDQVHASLARIRAIEVNGETLPQKYKDLSCKDQFSLIALIIWTRVRAWELSYGRQPRA